MTIRQSNVAIAAQQVNTTTGNINNSQEIQTLSDGTFVIVYQVSGTVHFQQFDQFGNSIGDEGTLDVPNFNASTTLEILAVEDNKLVLAYETTTDVIQVQSFEILNGVATETADISHELSVAGLGTANIAPSLSGTSLVDVSVHALLSAAPDVRELHTFTDLNTATPQSTSLPTNFTSGSLQEAAVLKNGNTVVAIDTNGQGGSPNKAISFIIMDPDGNDVGQGSTNPDFDGFSLSTVREPQITALEGGGFVVAYTADLAFGSATTPGFEVFDEDGISQSGPQLVEVGSFSTIFNNDENNDPEIVSLEDGGFVIFFDRDTNDSRVLGVRYDADGDRIGEPFEVASNGPGSGGIGFPVATLLDDGLLAVSFSNDNGVEVALVATEELDVVLTDADETITGTIGDDTIDGAGGDDVIKGGDGDDTLIGGAGQNTLNGNEGDDTFIGGAGADSFDGGSGADLVSYADATEGVTASLADQSVNTGDAAGDTYTNINGFIGTDFADTLTGNNNNNTLIGGAGADVLNGESGRDALIGGAGADILNGGERSDLADYSDSDAGVIVELDGSGNAVGIGGHAEGDQLISVENLIGSAFDDVLSSNGTKINLEGGAGNDMLTASSRNRDNLTGGTGDDVLNGQSGNDGNGIGDFAIYTGASTDYLVGLTETANVFRVVDLREGEENEGVDTLLNIEHLRFSDDDFLIEDLIDDTLLLGTNASETITAGDGVVQINGLDGDDEIIGNSEDNTIFGEAGSDTLTGGSGADTLDGGAGIDTLSYETSAGGVVINLTNGVAFGGDAEGDTFSNFENVDGSNFDDIIRGDAGANTLIGLSGADTLIGLNGDDTLIGRAGDDRILGLNDNDTMRGGGGNDIVNGGLGDDFLFGDGGDDFLNGGAGIDEMNGGDGIDTMSGAAGNDVMFGGDGNDIMRGGGNEDQMFGEAGDDFLAGDAGIDILDGGSGDDTLKGAAGADIIIGGSGNDLLEGGVGNDVFVFNTDDGSDRIRDWNLNNNRIDFSGNNNFNSFAEVQAAMTDLASGSLKIGFDANNEIIINNTLSSDFTASDFIF